MEPPPKGPDASEGPIRVVDRRWWARGDAAEPSGETAARKPTYVEELEQRLADAAAQAASLRAEHRRALEEIDQVRARLQRGAAREVERGRRAILVELLDVVDNLDRAIAAARDSVGGSEAVETLARGVELVRDQFLAKLASFGVARQAALGQPFDARRHDAVSAVPVEDPDSDGTVIAVLKEGYLIGDEVLRSAAVVVGRRE
jgi:molecular chaperone GrpE